ncbi:MAG: GTPase Era [Clostridia bacterium]
MFKSGFVAVVGKPNAGKSTLINSLVGYKVAITTPKPQTTRFNIKGIVTSETSQIIFVDTPGIHRPKNKLGKYMMKSVEGALDKVDAVIYLVDATKKRLDEANMEIVKSLATGKKPVILAINKVDAVRKPDILEIMKMYIDYSASVGGEFKEIIPISVYKKDGLDVLVKCLEDMLEEGEMLFPEDDLTDITEREIAEETIREKALKNLNEEVPHGINVEIQKMKMRKTADTGEQIYDIEADIICEKKSHKGIVIGAGGEMLKKIGTDARLDLERSMEVKVNLKLWVKVRENWIDNENFLKSFKAKTDDK